MGILFKNKKFYWNFGTTSFRNKQLKEKNIIILKALNSFWKKALFTKWDNYAQQQFYKVLMEKEVTKGTAKRKEKDARQITSSLYKFGLITADRKVTDVGNELIKIIDTGVIEENFLCISSESYLYFLQFLKIRSIDICPINVLISLLLKNKKISFDFAKYFLPLITNSKKYELISKLKKIDLSEEYINKKLSELIFLEDNYKKIAKYFISVKIKDINLFSDVVIDRKSSTVSSQFYLDLYESLIDFNKTGLVNNLNKTFLKHQELNSVKKWKKLLYTKRKINFNYLSKIPWDEFDDYFIKTLHCLRIKSTLEDYFDLNCRHLRMTDIFNFDLKLISLVSNVEKVFKIIEFQFSLLNNSKDLEKVVDIVKINNCFKNINNKILHYYNINESDSNSLKKFAQIINTEKEKNFLNFINEKFTNEFLINVLKLFETRKNDNKIWKCISDEATIPAIYEYIITIVWWKILKQKVSIYDLLKNKIDSNFLPIHHTTGLKADIFFEIEEVYDIPKHTLLVEVTLSENKGQRKMELEPVHRHTLDQVIKNINLNKTVLTYFISPNVDTIISQMFRNYSRFPIIIKDKLIEGVNIMSLTNELLIKILQSSINYKFLYNLTIDTINSSYNQEDWFKKFENNIFNYNEKDI